MFFVVFFLIVQDENSLSSVTVSKNNRVIVHIQPMLEANEMLFLWLLTHLPIHNTSFGDLSEVFCPSGCFSRLRSKPLGFFLVFILSRLPQEHYCRNTLNITLVPFSLYLYESKYMKDIILLIAYKFRSKIQSEYYLTGFQAPGDIWLWMHLGRRINALHLAENCVILRERKIMFK